MYPNIVLSSDILIPTYWLVISSVYSFGIFWFYKRAENNNLPHHHVQNFALIFMLSGLVGARLFHVFYEFPQFYIQFPLEAFKLWNGGFVFYGGAIAVFLTSMIYLKKNNLNWKLWADTIAPVAGLGYAFGRLGCFLAGCCYGSYCDLPWAIEQKHPTQLYALIIESFIVISLLLFEKKKFRFFKKAGNLFFSWVVLHSLGRIFMEIFRDDPRGFQILNLSISTFLSLLFCLLGAWHLLYGRESK